MDELGRTPPLYAGAAFFSAHEHVCRPLIPRTLRKPFSVDVFARSRAARGDEEA